MSLEQTIEQTIEQKFAENAVSPKKVKTDSGEVEQHSLRDQIKALEYLKKKELEEEGGSVLKRLGVYGIGNYDN